MPKHDSSALRSIACQLDALERVLEEEFDALKRTDADELTSCCKRKAAILDVIARTQDASGGAPQRAAPDDPFPSAQNAIRDRLKDLWSKNQRNGLLIAGCRQHTRRALEILTGGDRSDGVYDPRAELPATDLGRSLGHA